MREIKFRAFDKLNECYGGECYLQVMGDGTLKYASALVVEQYTGLKDKDGIEIYEGDRVQILYNGLGIVSVTFNEGRYNISAYNMDHVVKVGNIHEKID